MGKKILFDQGTPVPLRKALSIHHGRTALELGWSSLENGALLKAAEGFFDILITTDQSLRYQQDLSGQKLAILVLPTTNWSEIQVHAAGVAAAVDRIGPGQYMELTW